MLIAAIQPVLIRLVPKGSKVCFWHLWVGPVLSSKQEEKLGKDKRIVSTTAVQSLTLFLDTSDCGSLIHLTTTQTQSVANNKEVVTSLMSQ